ncbi:MAG: site-specific integrase [Clostridia bacterium]|nr:site-specific integrase [Clostridia bacterium]
MPKKSNQKKTKSRGNGDGSVYFSESKNKWVAQVTVGRTPEGKLKRKALYGKTRKEVTDLMKKLQSELQYGFYLEPSTITVGEFVESLINEDKALNIISESTYSRKRASLEHIKGATLGGIPLQKAREPQIKDFLYSITQYSNSVISKDYGLLERAFSVAVKQNIIQQNPMLNVRKPKSEQSNTKVRALTVDEQVKLMRILDTEKVKYSTQMKLMMLTGMRMGEINALSVDDFNKTFKTLNIHRTVTLDSDTQAIIGSTTKTYAGTRKIPLTSQAYDLLCEHTESYIPNRENLLFIGKYGVISTNQVNHAFQRLLEKYDIIDDSQYGKVSLHSLRHTYATRCIEGGMPAKVLQTLLGHTDIKTTLNTYCDAFGDYQDAHIKIFEDYMNQIVSKKIAP